MTKIIASLADVSGRYDAVLCDLWGCYHNGETPHAGAISGLRAFRKQGGVVALLTNAPRPDFSTARQLERMGAPSDTHDLIVTSGMRRLKACALAHSAHAVTTSDHRAMRTCSRTLEIERVALAEAEFILCSGLDDDATEGPHDYAERIARGVAEKLPMVCANPDIIVDRGERRLFCAGAIAEAYAQAGGEVHLYGKPHAPIYKLAMDKMANHIGKTIPQDRILAIGDGPSTDVLGGMQNGFDTLFIAGGLAAERLLNADGTVKPDALNDYFTEHAITPTYALGMLA